VQVYWKDGAIIYIIAAKKINMKFGCGFTVSKEVKHLVVDFIAVEHRIC
jgi:hypothetical protein